MAGKHASHHHALYCTTRLVGGGYKLWRKVKHGSHDVVAVVRKFMCLFKTSKWTWVSWSCSWAFSIMSIGCIAPLFLKLSPYMEIGSHIYVPAALSPLKWSPVPFGHYGEEKCLCLCRESNSDCPVVQPIYLPRLMINKIGLRLQFMWGFCRFADIRSINVPNRNCM